MLYAASASSSWLDRSQRGRLGGSSCCESESPSAASKVRFIIALKSSSDSAVGLSRYLSTKAAIPCSASASATCQPSLSIDNHMKPQPGATITAARFALSGSGRKGVSVAVEIFRDIGSPNCRDQVSGAG